MDFLYAIFIIFFVALLFENSKKINNLSNKVEQLEQKLLCVSNKLPNTKQSAKENLQEINYDEKEIFKPEICEKIEVLEVNQVASEEYNIDNALSNFEKVNVDISANVYENINSTSQINETNDNSIEKIFMGNLFNKIGAVILIVAIIFFVKLTGIEFTPLAKVLIAYFASICSFGYSYKLYNKTEKESLKQFAQAFYGIGAGVAFVATYSATSFFKIMPSSVALLVGVLLIGLTYYISDKYKSASTVIIGLIGAYLNLYFANENLVNTFLISYLIVVNLFGLIYVYKNSSELYVWLAKANLLISTLAITYYSTSEEISIFMPISLWLIYFINDIVLNLTNKNTPKADYLNWLNLGALVWLINAVYKFENPAPAGYVLMFCAMIYAILCLIFKNRNIYTYSFIVSFIGATYFLSQDLYRICLFAYEALLVSYFAKRTGNEKIQPFSLTLAGIILVGIFLQKNIIFNNEYDLIFNPRAILFLFPALCLFISGLILKKQNKGYSSILSFVSLSLMFAYLAFEINSYSSYSIGANILILSILIFMYCVFLMKLSNNERGDLKDFFCFIAILGYIVGYMILLVGAFVHSHSLVGKFIPFINLRMLAYMASIGAIAYINRQMKSSFIDYFCLFTASLALYGEAYQLAHYFKLQEASRILGSIALSLFAFILMITGITKKIEVAKKYGIVLLLVALLKIMLVDLANTEAIYRLIAFIVLGSIMMLVSYYYTKKADK